MTKEAKSFHMHASIGSHALSAEPFYLRTILARGSRVLPCTSASRFTDTCAGAEPFHLRTNSWQRKQILPVYICL